MPPSPIDWSHWQGGIFATLMFIIKNDQILLIEKKRGIGAGKINGPGGKIELGETPLEAAIRETQEEVGLTPTHIQHLGELQFAMSDCPNIHCQVFRADDFHGTPTETDEALPFWCPISDIPYAKMWQDDEFWFPMFLNRQPFLGKFVFTGDQMQWMEILPHPALPQP